MPNLSLAVSALALFVCQIAAVYIVIAFSLYNLTQGVENKELWESCCQAVWDIFYPCPYW